jgi:DNA repair protein REV1
VTHPLQRKQQRSQRAHFYLTSSLTNLLCSPQFLGHGICDTYVKQAVLVGPGGRATSDHAIIGERAWRLVKAFKFDPKELRGIGIQITKLEHSSTVSGSGQGILAFTSVDTVGQTKAKGEEQPSITIQSSTPTGDDAIDAKFNAGHLLSAAFELPSLSQVDMDVLEALPADLRQEVEAEIQWRSRSSVPGPSNTAASTTSVKSEGIPRTNLTNKGSVKEKEKEKEGRPNLKRITQQLAPRNPPILTSQKRAFFEKREVDGPVITTTDAELRKLDIDPSVFAVLPRELQKEQLAMARRAWNAGGTAQFIGQRKTIKPYQRLSRSPSVPYLRRPLPKAKFLPRPTLKQHGKGKGERIHFSETEDVQNVIEKWVLGYRARPPNEKDVRYFEKFLVECIQLGGDAGIERATKVAKWWLLLLKRHWGEWEDKTENEDTKKSVGYGWWMAFWEVKEKMDVAARQRFGGTLSLK